MAALSLDPRRRTHPAAGFVAALLGCALVSAPLAWPTDAATSRVNTMPVAPAEAGALLTPRASRTSSRRAGGAVTLDAASSDVDYRSNTVVFRDIVISQGDVRVAAVQARATGLDFEDSTWNFTGAVRISVDGGALRSDDATVKFGANRVAIARIRGTPAEFEQLRRDGGEPARGRASTIEYDVLAGTVRLIGDAWLSDGRNEIRGQELNYDVRAQRVQSGSRPGQSDRVQITIRPREAGPTPPGVATPPDPAAEPRR